MPKQPLYSDDTCKLLISLVKQNELLYDNEHQDYGEQRKKDEIWKEIGKSTGMPAKECRRMWTYMRDNYRHILKNLNSLPPEIAKRRRRFKYEKEIEFVKPFLKTLHTAHKIPERKKTGHKKTKHLNTDSGSSSGSFENEKLENDFENDGESFDADHDNDNYTVANNEHLLDKQLTEGLFVEEANVRSSSKKRKYESESDDEEENDEIGTLFKSLGQAVRKLDPVTQALIKHKVTSFVFELELSCLKQK